VLLFNRIRELEEGDFLLANILLLAPYSGLRETALAVIADYPNANIDVHLGNYILGPKIIKKLSPGSYDVIITRGGSVLACQKSTDIPIIEIHISAFDMIRILKLAENHTGKKAILAYTNISQSFENIRSLLNCDIELFSYENHNEVKHLVDDLARKNYKLIIGDCIVYRTAKRAGLTSMLITSGSEAVRSAINEALRIYEIVIQAKSDVMNILSLKHLENNNPNDKKTKSPVRALMNYHEYAKGISIERLQSLSESNAPEIFPDSLQKKIKDYSHTPLNTVLTGCDDMCKEEAAYLIACYAKHRSADNFITLHCGMLENTDASRIKAYLTNSFASQGGVIFLDAADHLSKTLQAELINILKNLHKHYNVKYIASVEFSMEICVQQKKILSPFRKILDEVSFDLPLLKTYNDELSNLAVVYLNRLSMFNGCQIEGIERGALELLSSYSWPGNLRQFIRVMNLLSLTQHKSYISKHEIQVLLQTECTLDEQKNFIPVDLSGSLKDIEKRILLQVLQEEGMNQKKVEARLQIPHTTLWRKLK